MKAIRYHEFGEPDVLQFEDAPIPSLASDEVLIKVAATTFNPADAYIRMGYFKNLLPVEFPFIPGMDVSGVIEKKGDLVKGLKVGDEVFSLLEMNRNGGAAEYVAAKAVNVVIAPQSICLPDAASIPSGGLTAWQGLFEHGDLQQGQRVLITAAAGGVGSIATQLAKWKGAYVIGTSSERSFSKLKELGADQIINYKSEKIPYKLDEKVDLIFNLSPLSSDDVTSLLGLLKEGGTLVSALNPADENKAKEMGVNAIRMGVKRNAGQLSQIAELVNNYDIKPYITERVTLNQLASVHKKAGQTHGKVLILVNDKI
ncbi:NADP-dependent oxidoreductase [uncultured Draconibacterium sp.]|uniref:NADP-dependent oxidoreductase n=1 Tax=uncultured Draconibacterium sp. TaxID=1573823 RepID=UPI003217D23B